MGLSIGKIILTLITLFLMSSSIAAQPACVDIEWNGDGDGVSWGDPDNWDTDAVPAVGDDVYIINAQVILSGSTTIKSLLLAGGNTLLTINSGVTLTIMDSNDEDCLDGIRMAENAQMINNGSVVIVSVDENGIDMNITSRFTNNGSISITNSDDDNGIDMNNASRFINNGSIVIDDTDSDGIDMDGTSQFTNEGSIGIFDMASDGIRMRFASRFTNSGEITLTDLGADGIGMQDNPRFTNDANGNISIEDYDDAAIRLRDANNSLINDGIIDIVSNAESDMSIRILGSVTNNGVINITGVIVDDFADRAINIEEGGVLTNSLCGIINIEIEDGVIDVQDGGTLTNAGIIASVENQSDRVVGTFTNNGQIVTPSGTYTATPNAVGGSGEVVAGTVPVTASLCSEPIPTMGQWGVIILGILLLIFSVVVIPEISGQARKQEVKPQYRFFRLAYLADRQARHSRLFNQDAERQSKYPTSRLRPVVEKDVPSIVFCQRTLQIFSASSTCNTQTPCLAQSSQSPFAKNAQVILKWAKGINSPWRHSRMQAVQSC